MQTVGRSLQLIVRIDAYRDAFIHLNGLNVVFDAIDPKTNFQLLYQLIYCVWICSFDYDLALKMSRYNAIPKMADILSDSVKEKVIRMIMATFRVSLWFELAKLLQ